MNFESIFSEKRVGSNKIPYKTRSAFQRDYDRLIFSKSFRKLQNKIHVLPLSYETDSHNRLTHSLEVASVGRLLATIVGERISATFKPNTEAYEFYRFQFADAIAAACLAHDIGNPPFGPAGEKAIVNYFIENAELKIDGRSLINFFSEKEWKDLTSFNASANSIRVLSHAFRGGFKGGYGLTYTTVASLLKYPCESIAVDRLFTHRKKLGFFISEEDTVLNIMGELNVIKESSDPVIFKRHPFVYLVEAADEICYSIVDIEDAYHCAIITHGEIEEVFIDVIHILDKNNSNRTLSYYRDIEDSEEAIAFLRAKIINLLLTELADVFLEHQNEILNGTFSDTLMGIVEKRESPLKSVHDISLQRLYPNDSIAQTEILGYHVMSDILNLFVPALLKGKPSHKDRRVLDLFPYQFTEFEFTVSNYEKVMSAMDFLSGMSERYATDLCRSLRGTIGAEPNIRTNNEIQSMTDDYDLAISFAGEDRQVAEKIATEMKALGYKIFYDKFNQANLWGKDLYTHLNEVYSSKATFCLMIISKDYALKSWTNHERTAAQAKAFKQNEEYILPLRLDDTEIPGLNTTVGYVNYHQTGFQETINLLETKIKKSGRR